MRTRASTLVRFAWLVALSAAVPVALTASPASARESVDPETLNPAPPDFFNASCTQQGRNIVCTLAFADDPIVGEPLGLACSGTEILFSQDRSVVGKRLYNADGDLVQRHFRESSHGTFSNPSTGEVLQWSSHGTVIHNLVVPGDLTTGLYQTTGIATRVYSEDGGTVLTDAGRVVRAAASDEIVVSNGPHLFDDYYGGSNPDALAAVCAALS